MKLWIISRLIGLLITLSIIFFIIHYCNNNGWHYQQDQTQESRIYSLHTSSEIKGNFILGIGSIKGKDYYVFYKKTNSGGLLREKIETSACILYEGYSIPKIMEYGEIAYHLDAGDTIETSFNKNDYTSHYHCIYIPKGTITERIDDINLN